MVATIILPNPEEWAVIRPFLESCKRGAVVIPPDVAEELRSDGFSVSPGNLDGYDYGGEADIIIDVIDDPDHYATEYLQEAGVTT